MAIAFPHDLHRALHDRHRHDAVTIGRIDEPLGDRAAPHRLVKLAAELSDCVDLTFGEFAGLTL
jgi:hypothetical protein